MQNGASEFGYAVYIFLLSFLVLKSLLDTAGCDTADDILGKHEVYNNDRERIHHCVTVLFGVI